MFADLGYIPCSPHILWLHLDRYLRSVQRPDYRGGEEAKLAREFERTALFHVKTSHACFY